MDRTGPTEVAIIRVVELEDLDRDVAALGRAASVAAHAVFVAAHVVSRRVQFCIVHVVAAGRAAEEEDWVVAMALAEVGVSKV